MSKLKWIEDDGRLPFRGQWRAASRSMMGYWWFVNECPESRTVVSVPEKGCHVKCVIRHAREVAVRLKFGEMYFSNDDIPRTLNLHLRVATTVDAGKVLAAAIDCEPGALAKWSWEQAKESEAVLSEFGIT